VTIDRCARVRAHAPQRTTIRCALSDVLVRHYAVPVVFFYDRLLDPDALAHGLGVVLGDFAPFNARLTQRGGELFLDCNDHGVAFSVVTLQTDMQAGIAWLGTPRARELVDPIEGRRALRGDLPLLTVRITHFADGKSCLGVCWHHSVGDMHSCVRLLLAWSRAVAGLAYEKPMVVEDRSEYLERTLPSESAAATGLRYLEPSDLARLAWYMLVRARDRSMLSFHFLPEELVALRNSLESAAGRKLSTNDALCAHMLALIAERDPRPRSRQLSIAINYRKRLGLPESLLGNMVTSLNIPVESGAPAAKIASDLRGAVNAFADQHMDVRANQRFVASRGGMAHVSRCMPKGVDPMNGTLLVTSWSKFGVYDVDFGREAPAFFSGLGQAPFPWLSSIFDGFRGHGTIFTVHLPRAIAARLADSRGLAAVHRFREVGLRGGQQRYGQRARLESPA